MATVNQVNVGLSGSTGSGTFVGSTSPTMVTPVLGAASATSLAFSSTSGIIGTTTNDNAAAGSVGEVISSAVTYNTVNLTTATAANITSISLTAGDWDVWGAVNFFGAGGTIPTSFQAGCSRTSATMPSILTLDITQMATFTGATFAAGQSCIQTVAPSIMKLSGTTTVYLVGLSNFSVDTMTAGGAIIARRVR